MNKKTWKEFKDSGLLWFVNMILHTFGWAIVFKVNESEITEVYPARVKFRGFSESTNTEGYAKIARYLHENIDSIIEDGKE